MWIATFVGAVVGGLWLVFGTLISNSAPQEAAIAGQAMALAVIPYVLARASAEWDAQKRAREAEED